MFIVFTSSLVKVLCEVCAVAAWATEHVCCTGDGLQDYTELLSEHSCLESVGVWAVEV